MRLRPRRFAFAVILVNVIVISLYLTKLQGLGRNTTDVMAGMPPFYALTNVNVTVTSRTTRSHTTLRGTDSNDVHNSGSKSVVQLPLQINSNCGGIQYPYNLSLHEGWYPVDDVDTAYVFSAYHDEREKGTISIIGAKVFAKSKELLCQVWSRGVDGANVTMTASAAIVNNLPEGHGRKYYAVVISCKVKEDDIPETVSIVTTRCATPLNLLRVKRIKPMSYTRKFTVCLTPFNFRYGKAYELVEWIEMSRILGAEFFTLYNFSIAKNVESVLNYYKGQGLAEVVNWNLPMGVDTWPRENSPVEIHYFAQLAAINECWRRNLPYSEYLVYTDLDEFIVPRAENSRTWDDIIKIYPSAPAFLFQNVFFRKEWDQPNLTFAGIECARKYRLVTLLKTMREKKIFTYNMRSKYIIRSDSALTLGIHMIPRLRGGKFTKKIPAEIGLLHHYRNWEKDDRTSRDTDSIMITKYSGEIIKRTQNVWSELSNVEMDIPIT